MMKFKLQQKAIIKDTTDGDDDRLIITGVASDTKKDRYNEYVTPETLQSLCSQAKQLNLHYNHKREAVIGTITDASIKNNQLHIQAEILPEYAKSLRDKLEFGIHYGLSIAGFAHKNTDGALTSYDLVEISLTEEPANPSTYATVQINNQKTLKSDCINGLCYLIDKETKNMTEKNDNENESATNNTNNSISEADLNNALNDLKGELLETLRDEFKEDMLTTIREDLKEELIKDVLSEINKEDKLEDDKVEETEIADKVEKTLKNLSTQIEERFNTFEEKHFKKLDETRDPEAHMTNTKNMKDEKRESNKKTIREISEQYGGV